MRVVVVRSRASIAANSRMWSVRAVLDRNFEHFGQVLCDNLNFAAHADGPRTRRSYHGESIRH